MVTTNTLVKGLRFLIQKDALKHIFYAWFPITFLLFVVEIIFAWELQEFALRITNNNFPSRDTILFSGLSLGLLVLLRALFQFFHHVLLARIRENTTAILRLRWVTSSLFLGPGNISTSQLQNALQEGVTHSAQFLCSVAEFYQRLLLGVCLLIPAMILGDSLFLLALILVVCTAWMVRSLGKRVMRRGNLRLKAMFDLNRKLINAKANQRFLKLTGNQESELKSIQVKNQDYLNFSYKVDRDFALSNTCPQAVGFLVVISVLCLASIQSGQTKVIAFAYILLRFSQSLAHCAGAYSQARSMQGAFDESMNLQEHKYTTNQENSLVKISSVSIEFSGTQKIQLKSGEMLLIKGPSGCGKTTILDHLMFKNKLIINHNKNFLTNYSSRLGYANHQICLIEGSLRDNLLYGHPFSERITSQDCVEVLASVNFSEILETVGLDGQIYEFGRNLSTGESQRISLARSILRKPDFLILDEAMSGLDFECEKRVWEGLKAKIPDAIVICVSHREYSVQDFQYTLEYSLGRWQLKNSMAPFSKAV